jgi:hypothetical protein
MFYSLKTDDYFCGYTELDTSKIKTDFSIASLVVVLRTSLANQLLFNFSAEVSTINIISKEFYVLSKSIFSNDSLITQVECSNPKLPTTFIGDTIEVQKIVDGALMQCSLVYFQNRQYVSFKGIMHNTIGDDFFTLIHNNLYSSVAGGVGVLFENKILKAAKGFIFCNRSYNNLQPIIDIVNANDIVKTKNIDHFLERAKLNPEKLIEVNLEIEII